MEKYKKGKMKNLMQQKATTRRFTIRAPLLFK